MYYQGYTRETIRLESKLHGTTSSSTGAFVVFFAFSCQPRKGRTRVT